MSKSMGVRGRDFAAQSMVAEQRAKSRGRHRLTPAAAFQGNEQRGGVGQRPFHPQVALENFHDFAGQRQGTRFPTLAENVQLHIGQFQIFDLKRQDLAGTQAIE
jgi:hypothetical protein